MTTRSRSNEWYSYAFYSSSTKFDETTFISGGHASQGGADPSEETLTIGSVPEGAVTMLVVQYSLNDIRLIGEYKNADHTCSSVNEAIEKWVADGNPDAVIIKPSQQVTHVYTVGEGKDFADMISAVEQWKQDGKPCAEIYVDSGVYITADDPDAKDNPLTVKGSENRLTIIGEDRETTVVKSTTGKYIHPAINIQGGNVTVRNITFIADHSGDDSFSFTSYKSLNSAYAVHCDGGSVEDVVGGVIEFDNCNMFSWQSCGLGCGTVPNGHVIVNNCDIRSYVPGTASDNKTDDELHAIYVHGSRGALVYHSAPKRTDENDAAITSNESFTLINSTVSIVGGTCTMKMSGPTTPGIKLVTFINNKFYNGITDCNKANVPSELSLNRRSHANNLSSVNSSGEGYSLLIQ